MGRGGRVGEVGGGVEKEEREWSGSERGRGKGGSGRRGMNE